MELCAAGAGAVRDGGAAELDRARPLAPGARRDSEHAQHRGQPDRRAATARSPAAGRGAKRPARSFGQAGRGSAHPCGQPRACAQDPADRADQCCHRTRCGSRRHHHSRGSNHAAPCRSPPRACKGGGAPGGRLDPDARLGKRRGGEARGRAALSGCALRS